MRLRKSPWKTITIFNQWKQGEKEIINGQVPAGLFFFPLLALVDWQCFGAVRSKDAVLQSALQPLDLTCLSLESGFPWCGTLCQPSSVSTREGSHSGVGTGAFVKAAQRGLPAFAVICVFKIGGRFSQVVDVHSFPASLAPAVNSCSINNGGCEQDCVQLSEDHYKCQCQPGYQLKTDAKSCEGESCAACLKTHSKGNLKDPRMVVWVTVFIPISPCVTKAALGVAY